MTQFLKVHAGSSSAATPEEALRLVTVAPARILGLADRIGSFAPGMEWSFIEVARDDAALPATAREAILGGLLRMSEADLEPWAAGDTAEAAAVNGLRDAEVRATAARLEHRVRRVTRAGIMIWESHRPA
jgi:predicted amidohydrolase YtcJ